MILDVRRPIGAVHLTCIELFIGERILILWFLDTTDCDVCAVSVLSDMNYSSNHGVYNIDDQVSKCLNIISAG